MAQRRTFGSIRKLPSGRWQASYLDPITRARVPGETTFATKADANRWLSSAELSLQRGDALDRRGRTKTLGEYSATWLAGKTDLRPKSRELYSYLLSHHIEPALGRTPLSQGGSNDPSNLQIMTRTEHRLGGNYSTNHPR